MTEIEDRDSVLTPRCSAPSAALRAQGWNTDADEFAKAILDFETSLPGFWWSVGQCSVGAHASCAVDAKASPELVARIEYANPLDAGFHCDTSGGSPADALRDVMRQAIEYLNEPRGLSAAEAPISAESVNTQPPPSTNAKGE